MFERPVNCCRKEFYVGGIWIRAVVIERDILCQIRLDSGEQVPGTTVRSRRRCDAGGDVESVHACMHALGMTLRDEVALVTDLGF